MSADFRFENHIDEVLEALEEATMVALEEIGLVAEGYIKRLCTVDTGLLRNSITHAVSGQPAAIDPYKDNVGKKEGLYSGTAPNSTGNKSVYMGTNVEYAAYVEMGTVNTPPQPYLMPAVTNHSEEYKKIAESAFRG